MDVLGSYLEENNAVYCFIIAKRKPVEART